MWLAKTSQTALFSHERRSIFCSLEQYESFRQPVYPLNVNQSEGPYFCANQNLSQWHAAATDTVYVKLISTLQEAASDVPFVVLALSAVFKTCLNTKTWAPRKNSLKFANI